MAISRKAFVATLIFSTAILVNIYRFLGKMEKKNIDLTICDVVIGTDSTHTSRSEHGSSNDSSSHTGDFLSPSSGRRNAKWTTQEAKRRTDDLQKLSDHIQAVISKRQIATISVPCIPVNPENCNDARLLVYDINDWVCGFGCTVHVTLQHFFLAFYTNRTFVLKSEGWGYDLQGWGNHLLPIGKCNYGGEVKHLPALSDQTSEIRIVRSADKNLCGKCDWKIPRNILIKLYDLHSDPYAWWIGQFINYMLRIRPWFVEVLEGREKTIALTSATVGLQIRWGDKVGSEANKHPVSEYMDLASKWFKRSEHRNSNKTVYVATEQSEAWKDLENNYHDYSFIGSGYVNRNKELDYRKAYHYEDRKNELEAILTDIYFLSKCRYLVCTFSSNVCRLLYEMMAFHNSDPQNAVQSLDAKFHWYMGGPNLVAIEQHDADDSEEDIDLEIGDRFFPSVERIKMIRHGFALGIDLWIGIDVEIGVDLTLRDVFVPPTKVAAPVIKDGYVLGTNSRTGLNGQVPMYKLGKTVKPLKFDV